VSIQKEEKGAKIGLLMAPYKNIFTLMAFDSI